MMKRLWWLIPLGAALLAGLFLLLFSHTGSIQAEQPSESLLQAADGLDTLTIEAALSPEERKLTVRQQMKLRNRSGAEKTGILLRAFANAASSLELSPYASEELYEQCYPNGYSLSALTIGSASLNGTDVRWTYPDEAKTVVSFPYLWQAEEVLLTVEYTVYIPRAAIRPGYANDIFTLSRCFLVPVRSQDTEDDLDPLLAWGDAPETDCMNVRLSLSLPKGYRCTGSGTSSLTEGEDRSVYTFEGYSVRSFGCCASPTYQQVQAKEGHTLLTASARTRADAQKLLKYLQKALRCYQQHFGAYPYPALCICESGIALEGAVDSGLLMIPSAILQQGGEEMELCVARTLAGEYWRNLVSPQRFTQAWQSETLCEFSLLLYLQDEKGLSAREDHVRRNLLPTEQITITDGVTPGAPLDTFASLAEFQRVVRNRGTLLPVALDLLSGGKLDRALALYYQRYCFGIPSREDFTLTVSEAMGEDILPLMLDYLDTNT